MRWWENLKSKRHLKILEIIAQRDIETQEDLAETLKSEGFDVTQATVSRVIKMQGPSGKYKYAVPKTNENNMSDKLTNVLANLTTSVENIDKMVVVKTVSAGAAPVAEAIDSFGFDEIAGTIAGENTIFIMLRTTEGAEELVVKIRNLIS